jgi:hypothetical protein
MLSSTSATEGNMENVEHHNLNPKAPGPVSVGHTLTAEEFDEILPERPEPRTAAHPVDEPDPIRFLDMECLANQPEPHWLIPGVIPAGLGFLIGAPGGGKSFLLLELANCICRNRPLFGSPDLVPEQQGWVLAILPEGVPSWAARLRAYLDFHGLDLSANFVFIKTPLNLADNETWKNLTAALDAEAIRRDCYPSLVIVDTLSASIPGLDENSQQAITPLTCHLGEWTTAGMTVIVSHHPGKYGPTYRGSSVLLGACDWMLRLEQTGHIREIEAVKLRDVESITPVAFTIQSHGDSAVPVPATAVNPWTTFAGNTQGSPGLHDAFLDHALAIPDTIRPARSVDEAEYKRQLERRKVVLIGVVADLVAGGVLIVADGKIVKKSPATSMKATVKQVFNDQK